MGVDDLLRELGRLEREDRESEASRLDERWDALAAGELSDEEVAALEALARESGEAAQALEAFRPLGEERRRAIREAARAGVAAAHEAGESGPTSSVRRFPRRSAARRAAWWLPAAALIAASLVLLLRSPADLGPLPEYTLELAGAARGVRGEAPSGGVEPGAAGGDRLLVLGNRLRLDLAPAVAVEGPLAAGLYFVRGGELVLLEPPAVEISASGSVRIEGEIGRDLPLPAGPAELVVVVGRPAALPAKAALAALGPGATRSPDGDWVAWRLAVRVGDDG